VTDEAASGVDAADAARVALRFCDNDYPGATTIVLAGSASTGRRTPTSDIDILLIAPTHPFGAGVGSEARVVHREGERIDVFAYTVESFRDWAERDFASLRPVLPYMLTEGSPLRTGTEFDELCRWSAERLARGPRLSDHQLELRRYAVTDLIDDLTDAGDPLIDAALRTDLFRSLAELALLRSNAWLGSGKWLARRLRVTDGPSADSLAAFAREPDTARAVTIASELLSELGGRVDGDFVR
jgi:predicted nucleotidyltransferase